MGIICNKCGETNPETDYRIYGTSKKTGKPLYDKRCKNCQRKRTSSWRKKNPEKSKESSIKSVTKFRSKNPEKWKQYQKDYRLKNIEKFKKKDKEYYSANRDKILTRHKIWLENNKEKVAKQRKEFYEENKDKLLDEKKEYYYKNQDLLLQNKREYYEKNKEKLKSKFKVYSKENREKINERMRGYLETRKKNDPIFKLSQNLRRITALAFERKRFEKKTKTREILGADWDVIGEYIQDKFTEGMSWENRNEWDVDHIIPLASAENQAELIALCHYTNLQPMWKIENQIKGDFYNHEQKEEYLKWYSENLRPIGN